MKKYKISFHTEIKCYHDARFEITCHCDSKLKKCVQGYITIRIIDDVSDLVYCIPSLNEICYD